MRTLDLKYRPKKFSDVIGNVAVVSLLKKLSKETRLRDRSIMLGGPKGCGKTSIARIIAKAAVCDNLIDGEPCNECNSCLSVATESSDSFEEFDAATQGTVDHMRSIVDGLEYGTISGKPCVFIMDEAHRLSKQAQDSLLKSIEDRRLLVILCTTEPHKIVGAIRSRVTEFPITPPSEIELLTRLESVCSAEKISYEKDALILISKMLENCPRECLSTVELLSPNVDVVSVQSHFRFGSLHSLVSALTELDQNPRSAISNLDSLMATEGPMWVRDNIILAISSAMRVSVGAKASFNFGHEFFPSRGRGWSQVARNLGLLDRPNGSDIEAILLSDCPISISIPTDKISPSFQVPKSAATETPTSSITPESPGISVVIPKPTEKLNIPPSDEIPHVSDSNKSHLQSVPKSKNEPTHRMPVEVDGVRFTPEESLTSLDSKLEKRGPVSEISSYERPAVELNESKLPLSGKEFQREFIQRFKKSQ